MDKNSEMHSDWKTLQSQRDMRNHKADTAYKHYYRKNSLDMSKKASKPGEYVDYIGDEIDAVTKNNPWKNESKNMNKKLIRLTESDLHRIVKESVNKILNESFNPNNEKLKFIIDIVRDLGQVQLSGKCGKYYALVDNGDSIVALYFVGKNGYDAIKIEKLKPHIIDAIYDDLYQDFGD